MESSLTMPAKHPSDFLALQSSIRKEEDLIALGEPLCQTPPEWTTFVSHFHPHGFIPYDVSNPRQELKPHIILLGETHGLCKPLVASALEGIAQDGDLIITEGKNKTVIPGMDHYDQRALGPNHFLTPDLFAILQERKTRVIMRQYKKANRVLSAYWGARLFSERATELEERRRIGTLSPSQSNEYRLVKRNAIPQFLNLLFYMHNQDSYFARVIIEESRNADVTYFPIGGTHVIHPVLREALKTNGVSYLALASVLLPKSDPRF